MRCLKHCGQLAKEVVGAPDCVLEARIDRALHITIDLEVEVELRFDVVVEGAGRDSSRCGHVFVGDRAIPALGEEPTSGIENGTLRISRVSCRRTTAATS
jgi:hypothetical protein